MNKLNHNIPKPKPRFNLSNNLYLKQYFNNKVNSSIKQNFNYSNIFTNTASKQNINKKENIKCSSCINTLFDTKKNIITNSIKKINIINNQKKEVNNKNYNNNLYRIFLNTSTQTRPNNEYNHNSTLVTSSSSKYDNKAKNKYITPSINENNKLYHSKKNIFIINNINNFYNNHFNEKTKNNSTKSSDKNMKHLTYHIVNKNLKKEIKNKILKYNIIDQDKQLDINIKYNEEKKNNQKKNDIFNENLMFKSNPNILFRKKYFKIKNNTIIELYYSYHDNNELFIALSEKSILGYNIKIIKFKNKLFVTRLKKHNNKIIIIKHFFNLEKMHNYIISGDMDRAM